MDEAKFDEVADFVIVGSGGGSMAAALYLDSIGRKPLILEKTDKFGGSTAMSGGILWVPNNHLLARDGIADSHEAGRTYMDATIGDDAGPGATPERKEAYLRNGPVMVKWLEERGMKWLRTEGWADYYDDRPGGCTRSRSVGAPMLDAREMGPLFDKLRLGPMVMPLPTDKARDITLATRTPRGMWEGIKLLWRMRQVKKRGKPMLSFGGSLQGRMLMLADKAGIDMRTNHGIVDLIEEDGRIVGVVCEHEGRQLRIGARDGVLINAGGFSRNAEMRKKYGPQPSNVEWTNANPGDTGEMIQIAEKHGAALDLMDQAWWVPGTIPPELKGVYPFMHNTDISKPHCIIVNRQGRRILNESGSYMENGQRLYQNDVPAYVILDSRHRKRYAWGVQPPGKTPREWFDSGFLKTAGTIEELAVKAGIDPAGLKAEVEKFNGYCETGKDLDFNRGGRGYDNWFGDPTHKPNPNLGKIEKPPFYAMELIPGDVGTSGGIVTDEYARALRPDGSVIPGLYATGNSTASVMGRCYPAAGASIGASFIFAWIAAHHATGGES
ncbi:3-oxosteroid 1-dehydrogenase [Sphingobium jiangsuense]|uniref:3-oxosteroid 1-dehydrogenase n=1 Tax=Sphingobium jiangsuense TaxID=870476 RepID=A0A7W6FQC5_9SPHN|nr:FAD-binding protein [Sphingobium jiangsuense]MBB3925874.1 3-oxosteroid 1-dehydrogenase [Sphingobium jiangsuense]GLS98701.1 3-oxosteroid 1-dehydrogenase [Sphingobium jiangsuense]